MNIVYTAVIFILLLGVLIFVHELGHFLVAKRNGIGVTEFSIGMGPLLHAWTRNGTRYALRWLPFGGYCMMMGAETYFDPEDEGEGTLSEEPEEKCYKNKPVWQRIAVTAAGPVFNFILAILLGMILVTAAGTQTNELGGVVEGYPAAEAGLQAGDRIVRIDRSSIHLFKEISLYITVHDATPMEIMYLRDGEKHTTLLTPVLNEETGQYMFGFSSKPRTNDLSFPQIIQYGYYEFEYAIRAVFDSLGMLVTGRASLNDVSGPVGIAGQVNEVVTVVQEDTKDESIFVTWYYLLMNLINMGVLISANLGIVNLLPVPGLDGGKLLLLVIEAIRGKPLNKKAEGVIVVAGVVLLLGLTLVVLINDIRKIFFA